MLAALDLLEDAIALAVVFETPESLFDRFFVSNFNKYHGNHHLLVSHFEILISAQPGGHISFLPASRW